MPLNAKNSKTEAMVLTKLEVWWHLIYKVYPSIAECIDTILLPYLNLCFGPLGDKPLFIQRNDTTASLGKKFPKVQNFAVESFLQLIASPDQAKVMSPSFVQECLPHPVPNIVFEKIHKAIIHCFGEILIGLGLSHDEDVKNKHEVCKVLWDSLVRRIEEYDKMKVSVFHGRALFR